MSLYLVAKPASKPTPASKIKVVSIKAHGIDDPFLAELNTIYKLTLKKNEESYFKLLKPISEAQVFLDMHHLNNDSTNLQSILSIVDEDGLTIKKAFIRYNEADAGYRKKSSLSLENPKIIGFRILNENKKVDFWLSIMGKDSDKMVPFFGKIIPKPLTLNKKGSGKIKENKSVYYAISLVKGDYKAILDFTNSKNKNTGIGGYLAILNPDGSNQTAIMRISEVDIHIRKGGVFSIKKDGAYIIRIENKNDDINYKLKIRKK